jgi:O-antigen/teichoic acid export membrane protein
MAKMVALELIRDRIADSVLRATGTGLQGLSGKAAISLLDQFVASGGNFLVSVLLARWLVPQEYGAFSVAFETFLFASLFHNALILEPMKVVGPRQFRDRIGTYLRVQLVLHAGVAAAAAGALLTGGLWLAKRGTAVGPALVGFGLALPFILTFWLVRHDAYVRSRPILALRSSLSYSAVLLAGLLVLWHSGWLSASRAGLLMGAAGLSAGAALRRYARSGEGEAADSHVVLRDACRENWKYGKWVLAAGLLGWSSTAVYAPLVAIRSGLEGAASLRAIQNLTLPMTQALTALAILLLPTISQKATAGGRAYLRRTGMELSLVLGGLAVLYVAVVWFFSPSILGFLYGGGKYESTAWLLPVYGSMLCVKSIADCGLGVALRAAGRSDLVFHATAGSASATVLIGLPLVMLYGLEGAATGLLLSTTIFFAIVVLSFRRLTS